MRAFVNKELLPFVSEWDENGSFPDDSEVVQNQYVIPTPFIAQFAPDCGQPKLFEHDDDEKEIFQSGGERARRTRPTEEQRQRKAIDELQ